MIEPFYSDDHVTIYHGNCLELADLWALCSPCNRSKGSSVPGERY